MIFLETEKNGEYAVETFRASIVDWFERYGKCYPWRETRDPYAILVSELMLQQTRIATVLDRRYFERWLNAFPTWQALAEAPIDNVLKMWEGLGYYNRARNLQKAAQTIVEDFDGECPSSHDEILSLPGVGRYTAGAVSSFAFGLRAPIVDGNIIRVLARVTALTEAVDQGKIQNQLWELAEQLAPEEKVREFNSGLMELGQQVCHRTSPNCVACPLQTRCQAFEKGLTETIPHKKKKQGVSQVTEFVGFHVRNGNVFLCSEAGSRRKGLWRLPELDSHVAADLEEIIRFPYTITRYKVDLRVMKIENRMQGGDSFDESNPGAGWFSLSDQDTWPALASPYRKAILKFLEISDDLLG